MRFPSEARRVEIGNNCKAKTVSDSISVVIPCFKTESCFDQLIERLERTLSATGLHWEVICVDDASPDGTWAKIQEAAASKPWLKGMRLSKNVGQQRAVLLGLARTTGDLVVTIDDDLEHDPADIPAMIDALRDRDDDIVIAQIEGKRRNHGVLRAVGTAMTRRLAAQILGLKKSIEFSSFRVMRGWLARAAGEQNVSYPVVGYVLLGLTEHVSNWTTEHREREKQGRSDYRLTGLIRYFFSMLLFHSTLPLQAIIFVGLFGAAASTALGGVYLVIGALGLAGVKGFTTIIVLLCFFSSMILLSLGVIGHFLMVIRAAAANNPSAYVRERAGDWSASEGRPTLDAD